MSPTGCLGSQNHGRALWVSSITIRLINIVTFEWDSLCCRKSNCCWYFGCADLSSGRHPVRTRQGARQLARSLLGLPNQQPLNHIERPNLFLWHQLKPNLYNTNDLCMRSVMALLFSTCLSSLSLVCSFTLRFEGPTRYQYNWVLV